MAWDGWYQFDGSEVINVARTEQYARNLGLSWLRPQFKNRALGYMLGDGMRYRTPLLDDAPWVDPDIPESTDFIGLYPLSVDGVESSTRSATITENIGNGGTVRGVRFGTKAIVFAGAVCASSEEGAEYGFRWLKQVLNGTPCGGDLDCGGSDLCYLSSSPDMELPNAKEGWSVGFKDGVTSGAYGDGLYGEGNYGGFEAVNGYGAGAYGDGLYGGGEGVQVPVLLPPRGAVPRINPAECLQPYQRTLRNVTVASGPTVTAKRSLSDGSAVWTVQFTAVAGKPSEFGATIPIIEGFGDPTRSPWAAGITPGYVSGTPYVAVEAECQKQVYLPVYDPLCPALIPPPPPASVALGCFSKPKNWRRRHITIPKENIPLWGEVVPTIEVHASVEVRALRMRFYADPFDEGNPDIDPCSFCGDILISFIPPNSTLVFDGVEQAVYVQYPGENRRRADSLVFKSDGTPFEWPALTCGSAYVVTFDMPQTQVAPLIDLSLTPRIP